METCRECFMNLYKKQATWFKEACTKPHLLVWAKLKGFPHWPGKVMSVNGNNQADVRFFGEHDRAWVAAKDCYLFSKETPNPQKTAKKLPLSESLLEAGAHVENLIKRFGSFNYAPYRTPLDTTRIDEHLKEMVPNAFEETRPSAPQLKIKIINNHGKMTAHTSKPSIGETPAPVEKTSSDISSSTDATNSKKRLTRRASKAATLIEGEAASEVPETERFGKVAKKRKSVCFLNQVATESSVEKLVIHRNLGNWATENITKRRKSVMVSPVEPNCESNAHGTESNGHVADQNPSVAEGGEGVQEVPSTGTSRNIASNPSPDSSYSEALSFPIPIKVELDYDEFDRAPSSGDSSASRSTATIEQTHERARPAAAVVSENVAKSNQKARKSFPGARTMTIVPKASVPESNSPIIMDSTTAAEAPANNGPASSNGTVGNKETPKPSSVSSSGYVVPAGSTNVQLPSNKVIKALPSMVLVRSVEKTVVSQSPPTLLQSVATSNNQQHRLASVSMTAAALPVAQVTTVISKPCPVVAPTSIPATVAPVKEPMQTSTQSVVSISSSSSSTTSTSSNNSSNNSSKSKENLGTAPTSAPILSLTPQEAPLNVPQNVASYKQQFRISPVSVPASGVLPLTNELPPATSAPQQSSAGSVNSSRVTVRNFGTANNNSNACSSLPEDLDVIVIDEGSPEPSPSAGRQNVKRNYSQRNSTLPPLQPKPRSDAQEEEFEGNVSVSELLDNYASQVAEKSRGMIEQTLRQLAEGGSLHAKVTQLTLELEQVKRQHSLTIERLTKEHQEQLKSMRLDKIRCLAKGKKDDVVPKLPFGGELLLLLEYGLLLGQVPE
ncbi:AGAP002983-PA-like protein [Anopheles sinensis]|uniref:AGAP002983-PA-like protein n=1 Tax=Anopheles sinensis TaxID=74873 RepID=A0A084VJB9_ANOSI|nr:AGAP002983-PA-like protein [Anopheles sinensis]